MEGPGDHKILFLKMTDLLSSTTDRIMRPGQPRRASCLVTGITYPSAPEAKGTFTDPRGASEHDS